MAMKNPPHPGLGLKADLDELGLGVAEAARGLGISRQQLYDVIRGKSAITPEMALRLEKGIGSTADHWLRLQLNHDLAQVRARETELLVRRFERPVA